MCFLPEFALESYSVKAINYVLKPISKEKLFSIFDEVLEQINLEKKENAVIVKNNESIQRTLTSNLVFVEVIGRKALAQKVWLISWKNVAAYSSFRSRTNGLFFRLLYKKIKKPQRYSVSLAVRNIWCERGDLNPHGCPLDPKSSASANSATLAYCSSEFDFDHNTLSRAVSSERHRDWAGSAVIGWIRATIRATATRFNSFS